jgi:hypothetical protein
MPRPKALEDEIEEIVLEAVHEEQVRRMWRIDLQ